jgi:hypothetical protein
MKKFVSSLFVALVLSILAMAQSTPYSTTVFSATFNGPVTVQAAERNNANTSSQVGYNSDNGAVVQFVVVRTIDHAIAVNFSSSDFYVDDQKGCESKKYITRGTWDNHPFTYDFCTFIVQGQRCTLRTRYIIVNPTTVILIQQASLEAYDDQSEWEFFEGTLNIR